MKNPQQMSSKGYDGSNESEDLSILRWGRLGIDQCGYTVILLIVFLCNKGGSSIGIDVSNMGMHHSEQFSRSELIHQLFRSKRAASEEVMVLANKIAAAGSKQI